MFYATHDSEGFHINQNADISKFATRAEAEDFLRSMYDPTEWTITIEDGFFGDCWIKSQAAPKVGEAWLSPFSRNQISVLAPGQHPGGKQFWATPTADVLIAIIKPVE